MIGYITVGTNNKDRAAKFYDTLFKELVGGLELVNHGSV